MKYISLIGLVSAKQILSQTPDESRSVFEQHREEASKTVSTQQGFESTKVADVAARNAKDTKESDDLKAKVRLARDRAVQGYTQANPDKQQWTGPEKLSQTKWGSLAQADPEVETVATKKTSQEAAKAAIASQKKIASEHFANHNKTMANATAEANAAQEKVNKNREEGLNTQWQTLTQATPAEPVAESIGTKKSSQDAAKAAIDSQQKIAAEHGAAHAESMANATAAADAVQEEVRKTKEEGLKTSWQTLGQAAPEEETVATKKSSMEAVKAAIATQEKMAADHGAAHAKSMTYADESAQAVKNEVREAKELGLKTKWMKE